MLSSPGNPGTLAIDDPTIVPPAWRDVAQASLDQFRACQAHSYKGWVYLSPPAIFAPGDATGFYRRGVFVGGSLLTAALAGIWLIERVFDLRIL